MKKNSILIKKAEQSIKDAISEYNLDLQNIIAFTNFGDISTSIAFSIAKKEKKSPNTIAEKIVKNIDKTLYENIEIVNNGFINFYFKDLLLYTEIEELINNKNYGKEAYNNKRVNLEFISANPTGPLVLVNARAGIVGNMLNNIFNYCGYKSVKETYINDAGKQIEALGKSILFFASDNEEIFPENGYKGEYIQNIAKMIIEKYGKLKWNKENIELCANIGKDYILKWQKKSLEKYGIVFDNWIYESDIRKKELIKEVISIFRERNYVYEKDGAIFFASSKIFDDKDRVIIKSNKEYSYLLPDIAYHYDKINRGFDKIIDILGPDHHGYIARMESALRILNENIDFRIIIAQLITLYKNKKKIEMSKRKGNYITMDELAEEIDIDVLKFIFLTRKLSQPLDFDIEKAKEQTMDNPVYYVQYAHARIMSVLDKARFKYSSKNKITFNNIIKLKDIRMIIIKLLQYPYILYSIADNFEIQKLSNYLIELSSMLHKFYYNNKIITNDDAMKEKIFLIYAIKEIIARGLAIMNIQAKNRMEENEIF